jgi:hypothetical protein
LSCGALTNLGNKASCGGVIQLQMVDFLRFLCKSWHLFNYDGRIVDNFPYLLNLVIKKGFKATCAETDFLSTLNLNQKGCQSSHLFGNIVCNLNCILEVRPFVKVMHILSLMG